jgi:FkbM family methyltransferase
VPISLRKRLCVYLAATGAVAGDDVEYYLAKGCRVVGVDANPALCEAAAKRFSKNVAEGTPTIFNCAVLDRYGVADFFIHSQLDILSTLAPAAAHRTDIEMCWNRISVPARRASSIIREYGEPLFVKIDVEFVDHVVLRDLLMHAIKPPYISAEAHLIDVYCFLVCIGYEKFKLVDGETVHVKFHDHPITRVDGERTKFDFREHSSGPFGEDVPGPWIDKTMLLDELMKTGLGWKDIHAKRG